MTMLFDCKGSQQKIMQRERDVQNFHIKGSARERGNLNLKEGNNFFSQKGMCNRSGDIFDL